MMQNAPTIPRTPFNDRKHTPTRAEIELSLGVLGSIYLKEIESGLDLLASDVNWTMYWHNPAAGWSSRASHKGKVLCILDFYRRFFLVTIPIPMGAEEDFLALHGVTPAHLRRFASFTISPGSKWTSFRIARKEEVRSVLAILRKKLELMSLRDSVRKTRAGSSE